MRRQEIVAKAKAKPDVKAKKEKVAVGHIFVFEDITS